MTGREVSRIKVKRTCESRSERGSASWSPDAERRATLAWRPVCAPGAPPALSIPALELAPSGCSSRAVCASYHIQHGQRSQNHGRGGNDRGLSAVFSSPNTTATNLSMALSLPIDATPFHSQNLGLGRMFFPGTLTLEERLTFVCTCWLRRMPAASPNHWPWYFRRRGTLLPSSAPRRLSHWSQTARAFG
jgi:hypothetical protein